MNSNVLVTLADNSQVGVKLGIKYTNCVSKSGGKGNAE